MAWLPLRKLDKAKKRALADGSLTAPAAESWVAAGGGGLGEDRIEEGEKTNRREPAGRGGDAQSCPGFVDRREGGDYDDNTSGARLLPSRNGPPPVGSGDGDVITAKDRTSPGPEAREAAQPEATAESGAGAGEQEAMESGDKGEEALTQPLLVSAAPAWN